MSISLLSDASRHRQIRVGEEQLSTSNSVAGPSWVRESSGDDSCPLPRYSAGGLGWGFARGHSLDTTPSPALPRSTGGGRREAAWCVTHPVFAEQDFV